MKIKSRRLDLGSSWALRTPDRLASFSLRQCYSVSTLKQLIIRLCEAICHAHPDDFEQQVLELRRPWGSPYFSCEARDLGQPEPIRGTDLYVRTKLSAKDTKRLCCTLLETFGYALEDFFVETAEQDVLEV